ncbi:MAG: phosphatidylglycerol lysyltransferase domain-containing protein, partial [Treponema sp.]|nr:phosphatidylglycerol lysyltransferase domain-containing protein [Treponema sp.]
MPGLTESQAAARLFFLRNGFLPLGRESYAVFKNYDTGIRQFHELTAAVSTIWAFGFNAVYRIIRGFLCSVWFYSGGEVYVYLQPPPDGLSAAGDNAVSRRKALGDLIETLRVMARGAGLPSLQIWAVDEYLLAELQEALAGLYNLDSEYSAGFSEYVYRVRDILAWEGGINLNKRNSLKRCFNTPGVSVRPLSRENFPACFEVEDEWCRYQDCDACRAFAGCGRDALKNMEEIFDESLYRGLLLYVDNKPEGYAIWEILGPPGSRTAYVYFAKANISNFNVFLYWTMAKDYLEGVEYLNNGYDMGKPGLRGFKKHLSVHAMMGKYLCTVSPITDGFTLSGCNDPDGKPG